MKAELSRKSFFSPASKCHPGGNSLNLSIYFGDIQHFKTPGKGRLMIGDCSRCDIYDFFFFFSSGKKHTLAPCSLCGLSPTSSMSTPENVCTLGEALASHKTDTIWSLLVWLTLTVCGKGRRNCLSCSFLVSGRACRSAGEIKLMRWCSYKFISCVSMYCMVSFPQITDRNWD